MDPTQISCRVFSLLRFFSGRFFLASVLTVFFLGCRSALFCFIYHTFECNRSCSITYCYFCGALPIHVVLRSGSEIYEFLMVVIYSAQRFKL